MYRINQKSFAEKSRDKTDLVKNFGRSALLLYGELENLGSFDKNDIYSLANKYNINKYELLQFLEQRKIIIEEAEKIAEESKQEPVIQQESIIQQEPLASQESIKATPSIDVYSLTPAEQNIYNKYGEAGVKVLRVYHPKKSFLQLADESGVSIDLVVEIADYIKIANLYETEAEESRFKPKIATDIEEIENESTEIEEYEINKDIKDPIKKYAVKYKMPFDLSLKFGQDGKIIEKYIDQNQKFKIVDIVVKLKLPIARIKEILSYISKEYEIIRSRKITRKELRASYGYESYAIYKKHGVEGLVLYNLLGGDMSVEDSIRLFVKLTDIKDPQQITELINAINQILGVKAILDESIISKILAQK